MRNFLDSSTIHGFVYLSNKYHLAERIFWTISLILSGIFSSYLVFELIVKIKNVPIISFESDQSIPVTEVDFPAITLCYGFLPELYSKSFDFVDVLELRKPYGSYEPHRMQVRNFTDEDPRLKPAEEDFKIVGNDTYYQLLLKLDSGEVKVEDLNIRILRRLQIVDLITGDGVFYRKNLSIPTDNILYYFNEFNKVTEQMLFDIFRTNLLISEILTERGFCYTFNLAFSDRLFHTDLVSADFLHEYAFVGLEKAYKNATIPQRLSANAEIEFYFSALKSFYLKILNGLFEGTFVYVHNPHELPTKSLNSLFVFRSRFFNVKIRPQFIITDESLHDLNLDVRNCYLDNEKSLKFFKVYTKTNCEHECMSEHVLNRCGCVEFFMIRNFTTRICSAVEKNCFESARQDYEKNKNLCRCLDPCNYIRYNTEFKALEVDANDRDKYSDTFMGGGILTSLSTSYVNEFVRKKQFNEVDFLSFVGGLLGLFAGFSSLSFIEIIFWMFKNAKRAILFRRKRKTSPKNLENSENNQQQILELNVHQNSESLNQKMIREYFGESSIHSFNYFIDSSIFEMIFWIFAFIFSISLCSTLIAQTNEKVPDSRVLSVDENLDSVGDIPFPAVTLSPPYAESNYIMRLLSTHPIYVKKWLKNNPKEEEPLMKNLLRHQSSHTSVIPILKTLGIDPKDLLVDIIRMSSQLRVYSRQYAVFNDKFRVNFSEIPLKQTLGVSFNLIEAGKLFKLDEVGELYNYSRSFLMRDSKLQPFTEPAYPIRMNIKDKKFELVLKLYPHPYSWNYEITVTDSPSFFIHPIDLFPNFHPLRFSESMAILEFIEVTADVTPEIIRTDESLRSVSPSVRECYFKDERTLKFFKIYTESNCFAECRTNMTFEKCGCVTVDLIYSPQNKIKFCHKIKEFECALEMPELFATQKNNCSCLPECNSINYKIKYTGQKSHELMSNFGYSTKITVRMNTEDAVLYRRYQQFTFSDVISYVGGLLGLFAGISVLSLFEVIYFLTLRLMCEMLRIIKERKNMQQVRITIVVPREKL